MKVFPFFRLVVSIFPSSHLLSRMLFFPHRKIKDNSSELEVHFHFFSLFLLVFASHILIIVICSLRITRNPYQTRLSSLISPFSLTLTASCQSSPQGRRDGRMGRDRRDPHERKQNDLCRYKSTAFHRLQLSDSRCESTRHESTVEGILLHLHTPWRWVF